MARRLSIPEAAERIRATAIAADGGCHEWTGPKNRYGYGVLWSEGKKWSAHRLIFTAERGPIPEGLVIDHVCHSVSTDCPGGTTCRHRACVNPAHMEPVTPRTNSRRSTKARQTHCLRGHEYTDANTIRFPGGNRACRTCSRASTRRSQERRMLRAAGIEAAA